MLPRRGFLGLEYIPPPILSIDKDFGIGNNEGHEVYNAYDNSELLFYTTYVKLGEKHSLLFLSLQTADLPILTASSPLPSPSSSSPAHPPHYFLPHPLSVLPTPAAHRPARPESPASYP